MNYLLVWVILLCGCQTVAKQPQGDGSKDVVSALGTVTEGLTNKDLSREDLRKLAEQVQKDPEARSAVQSINQSFNIQDSGIKYCPVDGTHFSSRVELCPEHKVKLIPVETKD